MSETITQTARRSPRKYVRRDWCNVVLERTHAVGLTTFLNASETNERVVWKTIRIQTPFDYWAIERVERPIGMTEAEVSQ